MEMITLNDINIRDPYIYAENGKYYLYGSRGNETWGECTGLDVYISKDLEKWAPAKEVFHRPEGFWSTMNYWAPEIHKYNGAYFMFVTFNSDDRCRGCQILKADSPCGPFEVYSDGPVTPIDWECLDGTFYVDKNGTPYMIFSHEWSQVVDGQICALQLSADLKEPVGEPKILFRASEPTWAEKGAERYVTDGPFMYRLKNGTLIMIWSSFSNGAYVEAVAYSDNCEITGNWKHYDELLFADDGGHGMIFNGPDNKLFFVCHSPNISPLERPNIIEIKETDKTLVVK